MTSPKSRSLTHATEGEMNVVTRAIKEALSLAALGRSIVWVRPEDGIPSSIAFCHSIIARGLADDYNFRDRLCTLCINDSDRQRERALREVESVMLEYKEGRG